MRPRFSLRLLMIAVTLLAIACYWFFVRPTAIAQRFVSAVGEKNYQQAESLCFDVDSKFLSETLDKIGNAEVQVEIQPRDWQDIWKLQRRMILKVVPKEPLPNSNEWYGAGAWIIATAAGITPPQIEFQTYTKP